MRDLFQTDWSMLGVVVEQAAEVKPNSSAKKTAKTYEVAGIYFSRSHSSEDRAKIRQRQMGHQRHTPQSRKAISDYHKRPDSVLRSKEVADKRTEGIRRSRRNPSAKLLAMWHDPGRGRAISAGKKKPIMTPFGAFLGLMDAADFASQNGLTNAYKKIAKWLKTQPDQYYYITEDTK